MLLKIEFNKNKFSGTRVQRQLAKTTKLDVKGIEKSKKLRTKSIPSPD